MPQLDFVWWMVKFFLVWAAILVVLTIVVSKETSSSINQISSSPKMNKSTAEWQWL